MNAASSAAAVGSHQGSHGFCRNTTRCGADSTPSMRCTTSTRWSIGCLNHSGRGAATSTSAVAVAPIGTVTCAGATLTGHRASVSRAMTKVSAGALPWLATATSKRPWRRPWRRSGPTPITVWVNGCTVSNAGTAATSSASDRERTTTVTAHRPATDSDVRGGCRRTCSSCS